MGASAQKGGVGLGFLGRRNKAWHTCQRPFMGEWGGPHAAFSACGPPQAAAWVRAWAARWGLVAGWEGCLLLVWHGWHHGCCRLLWLLP